MKTLLNIILLSPLLIYVILMLLNGELLKTENDVSLLIWDFTIPVFTYVSIFFVLYILSVYFLLKFTNFFVSSQNKNLTGEVNDLKAQMHDREPKLLEAINTKFGEILEKSAAENKKNIDIIKKENEKVVTSLNYDLKIIKEKIEKIESSK